MDDPVVNRAFRARLDRRSRDWPEVLTRDPRRRPWAAVTLATFCIGALSRLGDKVHEAPENGPGPGRPGSRNSSQAASGPRREAAQ